ncbi:MAG: hypothetical protein J6T39_00175, partial [Clostridia bacterium]|nr:hypothetical protein [Clostridia bacterium]
APKDFTTLDGNVESTYFVEVGKSFILDYEIDSNSSAIGINIFGMDDNSLDEYISVEVGEGNHPTLTVTSLKQGKLNCKLVLGNLVESDTFTIWSFVAIDYNNKGGYALSVDSPLVNRSIAEANYDINKSLESFVMSLGSTIQIHVSTNPNNATIQTDDENPGFAYLSVKSNSYSTFSFTIEWGPINANRPSKTYRFTIDKTDIKDFVKLAVKEQNNYTFFDGIITNNSQVRALYGQNLSLTEEPNATKDSGAGILMTYTLLQMSASSDNPQIINNTITNGYGISNLLEDNAYAQYIGEGESRKPNHFPDVNAIFVLNFVDDAGNTYTRYLIVDHTSPKILYRVADQNGVFPENNQGWMELTYDNNYIKTNAEIYYGNYKSITIDTTNTAIVDALSEFVADTNVKIENNHLLVKLNNSKVSETVIASRENQTNLPPKYSYDILGNSTVGMLIISFDSIQLEGNLSGNYPNNIQNIGNLDNYGTRTQSSTAIGLYSNGISTRQYLQLKWKVLEENYVVEKVEYEYYPFDLTSNSLTNPNYPFSASPDAVEPTVVYERNNDAFAGLSVVNGNIYT